MDHPPSGHDDVANSVAGALVMAFAKQGRRPADERSAYNVPMRDPLADFHEPANGSQSGRSVALANLLLDTPQCFAAVLGRIKRISILELSFLPSRNPLLF